MMKKVDRYLFIDDDVRAKRMSNDISILACLVYNINILII
jgi:hypothetical protein